MPASTPKKKPTPPHIDALLDTVSGHDIEHALRVTAQIMHAGAWRSWMVKWFIRRHPGQASRLMRRLGPIIPASSSSSSR